MAEKAYGITRLDTLVPPDEATEQFDAHGEQDGGDGDD
jgi:hypothetical protein